MKRCAWLYSSRSAYAFIRSGWMYVIVPLVFGLSANFDFFCQSPTRMTVILSFSFLRCICVLTYDLLWSIYFVFLSSASNCFIQYHIMISIFRLRSIKVGVIWCNHTINECTELEIVCSLKWEPFKMTADTLFNGIASEMWVLVRLIQVFYSVIWWSLSFVNCSFTW